MAARKFIPSLHPRDRNGRFTRSRSAQATPAEKKQAVEVAKGLKPKRGVTGAKAGTYLSGIGAEQHRGTVHAYTSGGFEQTHKALRAGNTDDPSVKAMDAAMVDLPDDLVVSRRVPLSAFGSRDLEDLVGLKVKDAAYSPTGIGAVRATKTDVRMRIAVPAGTRAAVDPDTGEVILDRDLEMVVARVEPNSVGGVDMFLTVLPTVNTQNADGDAGPAESEPGEPDGADKIRKALMTLKVAELRQGMRERGLKPGRLRKSQMVDALVADELGDDEPRDALEPTGKPDTTAPTKKAPAPKTPPAQTAQTEPETSPATPGPAGVERAVRDAYRDLVSPDNEWVGLADLRARIDGPRDDVDGVLRLMARMPGVLVEEETNQKALTPRDRDAAVLIGGRDQHVISIDPDAPAGDDDLPAPDSPASGRPVNEIERGIRRAVRDLQDAGGTPSVAVIADRLNVPEWELRQVLSMMLRLDPESADLARSVLASRGPTVQAAAADADAVRIQQQWDAAKARLLERWPKMAAPMVTELAGQAEAAVEAGDLARLGELQVSAGVIAAVAVPLRTSGTELAVEAAAGVVEEAAAQGVSVAAPDAPARDRVKQHADAVARIIAGGYASGAAKTALQLAGAEPADVRAEVERHLTELGESVNGLAGENIGSLLSAAQFAGRLAVLEEHPAREYRATETLDHNTCRPCRDTDQVRFPTLRAALAVYPLSGQHKSCEGRARCRGYIQPIF